MENSLVIWNSKKQIIVSKSSTDAEYRSLVSIVAEVVWIVGIIKELGIGATLLVKVYSNSKVAIQIATNPVYN